VCRVLWRRSWTLDPSPRGRSHLPKDANTLEWTDRQNGRISVTGVNQVSEDGKTMTETTKSFDAQGKQTSISDVVFDKE
jgi:hypothetical protein